LNGIQEVDGSIPFGSTMQTNSPARQAGFSLPWAGSVYDPSARSPKPARSAIRRVHFAPLCRSANPDRLHQRGEFEPPSRRFFAFWGSITARASIEVCAT
jgi:hypothetical protein